MTFSWKGLLSAVALAALTARPAVAGPIVMTNTAPTAQQMVDALLGGSSGITIVGTPTYVGATGSAGLFTGGSDILPFDAGVALTSGAAASIPGPNDSPSRTTINGTAGDAELTALAGGDTQDAARLTFSFIPTNDQISFQYVFGSEEYNEFVGSVYNDVFAFFLNGVNIALIPDTTTAVTINNVNAGANSEFFYDNTAGGANIEYDGLVGINAGRLLFATGRVTAGEVNTISLAIADTGDGEYDSGVLLVAGSFDDEPPPNPIPEPGSMVLLGTGAVAVLRRLQKRA